MQTFLPFADFAESARVLDRQRLGKQRAETLQIMQALVSGSGRVTHHPIYRQWRGYELLLLDYQLAVCDEWSVNRGYRDTCAQKTLDLAYSVLGTAVDRYLDNQRLPIKPAWLGSPTYHLSHQSNLLRKNRDFYGHAFPGVPDDLDYVWPEGLPSYIATR